MGGRKETCRICIEIYEQYLADGDLPKGTPFEKCSNCPAVELVKENHAPWEVYTRCWNQVICSGMGEVVGLNVLAVYRIMQSLKIKEDDELAILDKVILLHDRLNKKKEEGTTDARRSSTPEQ